MCGITGALALNHIGINTDHAKPMTDILAHRGPDDVGRYAEKAGLYVLTQTDEGGATLLNREGFEPRTFN
ncbi:MAG: hypothetical protein U5R49_07505 [Deltaproteobacteria bacterium]|nr:hypothetical protein [Deltaproteobacteria bacterium]